MKISKPLLFTWGLWAYLQAFARGVLVATAQTVVVLSTPEFYITLVSGLRTAASWAWSNSYTCAGLLRQHGLKVLAFGLCWIAADVAYLKITSSDLPSIKLVPRWIVEAGYSPSEIAQMPGGNAEPNFVAMDITQTNAADKAIDKKLLTPKLDADMDLACNGEKEEAPSYTSPTPVSIAKGPLNRAAIEKQAEVNEKNIDRAWSDYQRLYIPYKVRFEAAHQQCEMAIAASQAALAPGLAMIHLPSVTMSSWSAAKAVIAYGNPALAFVMPDLAPDQKEALLHPSYRAKLIQAVKQEAFVWAAIPVAALAIFMMGILMMAAKLVKASVTQIALKGDSVAAEMIAAVESRALDSAVLPGRKMGGPGSKRRL